MEWKYEVCLKCLSSENLEKSTSFLTFFDVGSCDETMHLTSISMCKKFLARMRFLQHFLDLLRAYSRTGPEQVWSWIGVTLTGKLEEGNR